MKASTFEIRAAATAVESNYKPMNLIDIFEGVNTHGKRIRICISYTDRNDKEIQTGLRADAQVWSDTAKAFVSTTLLNDPKDFPKGKQVWDTFTKGEMADKGTNTATWLHKAWPEIKWKHIKSGPGGAVVRNMK